MVRQLRFAGIVLTAGFALAAVYGLIGPKAHSSALSGSVIISTGVFDGANAQVGSSIPSSVDTAAEFKTYINNMLFSVSAYGIPGSSYNAYGAAFIVETMLHGQINYNADDPTLTQARNDFNTWANYIDQYQAAGRINWSFSTTVPTGAINSMHVCDTTKLSGCGNNYRGVYNNTNGTDAHRFQFYNNGSPEASTLIVFTNANGTTFQLRRECANVTGSASPLSSVGWTMSGHTDVDVNNPLPGTTIKFTHYVKDDGPSSTGQDIWWAPLLDPSNVYRQGGQNSGQYTSGQEKTVGTDSYVIPANTPPGTVICEKVLFDFADSNGGRNGMGPPKCATVRAPTTSCGTLITPPLLGSSDPYSITGTINTSDGKPGADAAAANSQFFIKVTGPNPATTVVANNANLPVTVGTGTLSATLNAPPTNGVGTYKVTYGLTGGVTASCSGQFDVSIRPYFSVLGGDIAAGIGFGDSCTTGGSTLKSWNTGTSTTPNYYGAGSEIGAWAAGAITDFVSGMGLSGGAASGNGYGLSFANTSNLGGGGYGGNFGASAIPCMYDYVGKRPSGLTPISNPLTSFASVDSGNYSADSGLTIGGSGDLILGQDGAGNGKQVTIYVTGNLYIKDNIKYSYANMAGIPRLNIYLAGYAYIDPNVSELHGVYIAQRKPDGTGGIINTCSPGTVTTPQPYATCNKQLKVVGAMAAQAGLRLSRTYGNLATSGSITNEPAEIFQYSPELWMSNFGTSNYKYQSYTSLPPVL